MRKLRQAHRVNLALAVLVAVLTVLVGVGAMIRQEYQVQRAKAQTWRRLGHWALLPVAGGQTNYPQGIRSRGVPVGGGNLPVTGGDVIHLDSGHTNANDGNDGTDPRFPMATLDAAIGRCTANNGDIILGYPGHVDSIGDAQIDADVAGISIIGMGNGPDRPRIDYDHANASLDIGANGVMVRNWTFRPSVTAVLIGIDIEATVTHTRLEDLEFLPGEAGDGTDEFVTGIELKATCTGTKIIGLEYYHHASAAGAEQAVHVNGISDRVYIGHFWIEITGAAAVAGILFTGVSTRSLIEEGVITSDAEPGIQGDGANTGIIRNVTIFSDLATIDAATVQTGMAHDNVNYIEVGNEAETQVKTPSVDD